MFPAFLFWMCHRIYYNYKKDMNRFTQNLLSSLKTFAKNACIAVGAIFFLSLLYAVFLPPHIAASLVWLTIVTGLTYLSWKRMRSQKLKAKGISEYLLPLCIFLVLVIVSLFALAQTIVIAMSV